MEVMVAVVFLSLCSAGILQSVTTAQNRASVAQDRLYALTLAQNTLDTVRRTAKTSALTPAITSTSPSNSGLPGTVTLKQTITAVSGYTNLYSIQVKVTWGSVTLPKNRSSNLTIETILRAPDV